MINNLGQNGGIELSKEKAEKLLNRIGFFDDMVNRNLFDDGDIKVFEEMWANELAVVLQPSTGETVFYDFRSA